MGIFLTQEEVLNRFKNKHGNKYDYSKVVFIGIKNKVEIICQTHGSFFQNPNKHYNGQGCPKCIGKNMSNNDFIERCNKKHKNKYDYSLTYFKRNIDKIKIICPIHGEFEQIASAHLHGNGCIKCAGVEKKTTEYFIEKSKRVHGDKYDYSLVEYISGKDKVKIICREHGVFQQNALSHLKGHICKKCSLENRMTTNDFINKSNIKHNHKYDYSLVEYKNNKTTVNIICPKHGLFEQRPHNHLQGYGCHLCAKEDIVKYQRENTSAWSVSTWDKASKRSKVFDSFKVYIIRCWNDEEEFYKVGRTFTTVKHRFENKKRNMPYNYEVIKEYIFDTAKEAFDYENKLKRLGKKHKYTPNIYFKGCT